jgi:hypothetical protein
MDEQGCPPRRAITVAVLLSLSCAFAAPAWGNQPPLGGWTIIASPTDDRDVAAAAGVLLAKIPVQRAQLARIETASRQIVAGTNFRLTVRLTDRSRWRGVVWHKPDGTFDVASVARVR